MADIEDPMRGLIGKSRPLGRVILSGTDDEILKWLACPDCGGAGCFVVNPFAPYGKTYRQCLTCEAAHREHAANSSGNGGVQNTRGGEPK